MENVDPSEIRKFEALAARWWDPNSEFKPLHEINPLRLNYISQQVNLAGKRVLDIGCGGGILAEAMTRHGGKVTAIDMGEASLSVAKLHRLESNLEIDYRKVSAEELAAGPERRFDVITCLEMLEHVPNPAAIVRACFELVNPGGSVFFSTINRNPKSYLFAVIGAEYLLNLLPRGTHEYGKLIKPSELARWGRESGLHLRDQTGMGYNPFSKRYFLQKNIDVNYISYYTRPDPSG